MKSFFCIGGLRFFGLILLGILFSILILFLQVGVSYYVSFQVIALVFIISLIVISRPSFKNIPLLFSVIFFFILLVYYACITNPAVISENTPNIAFTSIGVILYASLILILANLKLKYSHFVLSFFKIVSITTILLIAALIVVTDLSLFPFLTREYFLLQNITLISNYINLDPLSIDLAWRKSSDISLDIDLFYGEPSFLAVVIFTCITSYILTNRLLSITNLKHKNYPSNLMQAVISKSSLFLIFVGLFTLIYIRCFSAMFYALIVLLSLLFSQDFKKAILKLNLKVIFLFLILAFCLFLIILNSYNYYFLRITSISDSISAQQRFGAFLEMNFQDYLIGITDKSRMPANGIQNGIMYVISISGIAGIFFMLFLLYRIYSVAKQINLSAMILLTVLAIFSQNGAILSPNKIVLLSLILLPLSCTEGMAVNSQDYIPLEPQNNRILN